MKTFEINPWAVVRTIRKSILNIFFSGVVFSVLGYAISFLFAEHYQSQTILLPESSSASGGGLSSLVGGLSNISNLDKTGALRSDLYPNILSSTPFALYVLDQPIQDSKSKKYPSFRDYISKRIEPKEDKKNAPNGDKKFNISNGPQNGNQIFNLDKNEQLCVKLVLNSIRSSIDSKTGLITIDCETVDPFVAATLTKLSAQYLIAYVDKYMTGKALNESNFLESRVSDTKRKMEIAEQRLQRYRDANRNPFLNVAKIEQNRLESDFSIAQTLYLDLQRKWEQAKIKVKEDQTILTVLEPPKVSTKASKPRRLVLAAVSGIFGVFISTFIALLRQSNKNPILVEIES